MIRVATYDDLDGINAVSEACGWQRWTERAWAEYVDNLAYVSEAKVVNGWIAGRLPPVFSPSSIPMTEYIFSDPKLPTSQRAKIEIALADAWVKELYARGYKTLRAHASTGNPFESLMRSRYKMAVASDLSATERIWEGELADMVN